MCCAGGSQAASKRDLIRQSLEGRGDVRWLSLKTYVVIVAPPHVKVSPLNIHGWCWASRKRSTQEVWNFNFIREPRWEAWCSCCGAFYSIVEGTKNKMAMNWPEMWTTAMCYFLNHSALQVTFGWNSLGINSQTKTFLSCLNLFDQSVWFPVKVNASDASCSPL